MRLCTARMFVELFERVERGWAAGALPMRFPWVSLHGTADAAVPFRVSQALQRCSTSADKTLVALPELGHQPLATADDCWREVAAHAVRWVGERLRGARSAGASGVAAASEPER
jgi:alpha-beta hydrolase superfamily lysophospholipase